MKTLHMIVVSITMLLFTAQTIQAADKTKSLLAIERSKTAVSQLVQRSSGNKLVEQDISDARSYLQQAEELYQKNLSWIPLKGLNDAAEPEILDLAEMSEHTAHAGLSKLNKQILDRENDELDKKIASAKQKVKILEEQAAELDKLKVTEGRLSEIKFDKAAFENLKRENVSLKQDLETLKNSNKQLLAQVEALKTEKASLTGKLEAFHTERKVDEMKSAKQLTDAERSATFKEKLSAIGAVTDITDTSLILVIPRSKLIKTTSRGHQLSPYADQQASEIISLISQFPEYQLSLQVFGYGKPIKLENLKAAEYMARTVRDFFALKLGVKSESIPASGSITASALFSNSVYEPHRRIELKFVRKQ